MNANRDLYHQWLNESDKLNSLVMGSDIERIGSTFKGNLVVDGKEVEAATMIKELGNTMKTKIAEVVANREAQEGKADLSDSQRHGRWAINCMQIGLILLGVSAITVLIRL
jgi:primase-polymerase (primpol)-like protein